MFENRQIDGYTYATRFIASWLRKGGQLRTGEDYDNFYDVLKADNLNLSLLRKYRKSTQAFALAVEALEDATATVV